MKAGIVFFLFAIRALRELDIPTPSKVFLQLNPDEEVGSESSRALTEKDASRSKAVLVLEPGTGLTGKLKTARRGVGDFAVTVNGPRRPFRALKRVDKRCSIEITGGLNRPPMERSAGIVKLFRLAQKLGREIAVELEESLAGGGSEGVFPRSMAQAPSAKAPMPNESLVTVFLARPPPCFFQFGVFLASCSVTPGEVRRVI
jgi:hypothetical protein